MYPKIISTINAYDLVLKKDNNLKDIIKSERQEIESKQTPKKIDASVSEYSGLRVKIKDLELRDSEEGNHNENLKSLSNKCEMETTTATYNKYSNKKELNLSESIPEKEKEILDIMKELPMSKNNYYGHN